MNLEHELLLVLEQERKQQQELIENMMKEFKEYEKLTHVFFEKKLQEAIDQIYTERQEFVNGLSELSKTLNQILAELKKGNDNAQADYLEKIKALLENSQYSLKESMKELQNSLNKLVSKLD